MRELSFEFESNVMGPARREGDIIFFHSYFIVLFLLVGIGITYLVYRFTKFVILLRHNDICVNTCWYVGPPV